MAAAMVEEMENLFDDHPSLAGSVDDFDPNDIREQSPQIFGLPSQHSGFRSEFSDSSEMQPHWAAPAWRKPGTGWYKNHNSASVSGSSHHNSRLAPSRSMSRDVSPMYEGDDGDEGSNADVTLAANLPLPASPLKRTPQPSAEPEEREGEDHSSREATEEEEGQNAPEQGGNYIRFAVRAEVQHRTEPVEALVVFFRELYLKMTKSRTSLVGSFLVALLSFQILRGITRPPTQAPVPDLVKVAALATSFEHLIYYADSGLQQTTHLQESSMAVWDLGESVRANNITSGDTIAKELDELSDDLRTLSMGLMKFFSSVNGDVDSIILVMEWARRELTHVTSLPSGAVVSVLDHTTTLLNRVGLLESSNGQPTILGVVMRELFGQTNSQLTRAALLRTFHEFLGVIEESISNELAFSTPLLGLYESIDAKYVNLHRAVLRESAAQEREEGELLAGMWTRLFRSGQVHRRKFERNRQLLTAVRARTVRNKHVLREHNDRLLQLKGDLENLRKRVVSPLVRSNDSSTVVVAEQIRGIEGGYERLSKARTWSKDRFRDMLANAGQKVGSRLVDEEGFEIEGGQ